MSKYIKQSSPFVVPTDDGKTIREHFGLASINDGGEPPQTPEFDEITFVFRGQKQIVIDNSDTVILGPGESLLTKSGCKVQYSNPFEEECEYLSISGQSRRLTLALYQGFIKVFYKILYIFNTNRYSY